MLVELFQRGDDRQTADKLRDQAVLDKVLGLDSLEQVVRRLRVFRATHFRAEADTRFFRTVTDDPLQAVERAAADEKDVGGINLNEVLVRVLAAALRRHGGNGALDELEERLLHALARDVAGDGRVVRLARDLVDLVDVDDAALRLVDVVVAVLQQLLDDVLDVFADIAGFRQRGRVRDHERDVEQSRQRLGEQRLARARGPDQEDVGLGELDLIVLGEVLEPLVVVVHRDRQDLFRLVLADDVGIEDVADLAGRRQVGLGALAALIRSRLFPDDVVAELDALVADEDRGAGDQLPDFVLALAAERAVEKLFARRALFRHGLTRSPWTAEPYPRCRTLPRLRHS